MTPPAFLSHLAGIIAGWERAEGIRLESRIEKLESRIEKLERKLRKKGLRRKQALACSPSDPARGPYSRFALKCHEHHLKRKWGHPP